MASLYDILEISNDATPDEIKSANKKLLLKWHPDKNSNPNAAAHFNKIRYANKILSQSESRKKYDEDLRMNNIQHYDESRMENSPIPPFDGFFRDLNSHLDKLHVLNKEIAILLQKSSEERTPLLTKELFVNLFENSSHHSFLRLIPLFPHKLLKEIIESEDIMERYARIYIERSFRTLLWNFSPSERWTFLEKKVDRKGKGISDTPLLNIIYNNLLHKPAEKSTFEAFILATDPYFEELTQLITSIKDENLSSALSELHHHLHQKVTKQLHQKKSLLDIQYSDNMDILRSTIALIKTLKETPEQGLTAIEAYHQKYLTKPSQLQRRMSVVLLLTLGLVCGALLASALLLALSPVIVISSFIPLVVVPSLLVSAGIGACLGAISSKYIPLAEKLHQHGLFQTNLQHKQEKILDAARQVNSSEFNEDTPESPTAKT